MSLSTNTVPRIERDLENDLINDPTLQHIDRDLRMQTVKLVIAITNRDNPAVEYRQLSKDLLKLSNQEITPANEKLVGQKILKTLRNLHRGIHYRSENEITGDCANEFEVVGEVHIVNLHAVLLGGEFNNDQLRAYVDCHQAMTLKLRGYAIEANCINPSTKQATLEDAFDDVIKSRVAHKLRRHAEEIAGIQDERAKKLRVMGIVGEVVDTVRGLGYNDYLIGNI